LSEDELVKQHTPLVASIVKKLLSSREDYDDYMQIGRIGLLKAIRAYADDKGVQFSTFAYRCIRNEILSYIKRQQKDPPHSDLPIDVSYVHPSSLLDECKEILHPDELLVVQLKQEEYKTSEIASHMRYDTKHINSLYKSAISKLKQHYLECER
jgi:RNA polymerase sigma factor (sigma-70 family)